MKVRDESPPANVLLLMEPARRWQCLDAPCRNEPPTSSVLRHYWRHVQSVDAILVLLEPVGCVENVEVAYVHGPGRWHRPWQSGYRLPQVQDGARRAFPWRVPQSLRSAPHVCPGVPCPNRL